MYYYNRIGLNTSIIFDFIYTKELNKAIDLRLSKSYKLKAITISLFIKIL